MFRRDFFKVMSAAAAALAVGGGAKATASISANATGFTSSHRKAKSFPPPGDPLPYVREVLKQCRVIGHELSMMAGELTRCRVTYRHDPNGKRTEDDLRWEEYLSDAKMVSVVVSTSVDSIDFTHLGSLIGPIERPVHDVEIEYLLLQKRGHA